MIVVIADDISGAAELAGAALRHGLSAEVQTAFDAHTDAEVVCVDTDSRSLAPAAAATVVAEVTHRVAAARPAWIYRKCDSVLRGAVLAESRAIMSALSLKRALIVPANPSRGRVIRDGFYFVGEQPLHRTLFARDPEHPRTTSRVAELLGGNLESIVVADTQNAADVTAHAATLADDALPVGGVDFFEALLRKRCPAAASRAALPSNRPRHGAALLVCGSAASWVTRRDETRARGVPDFEMPHDLTAVCAALRATGKALIGIGDGAFTQGRAPVDLARALAEAVAGVVRNVELERLLLEGGATTVAVVRALGWSRLRACEMSPLGIGILEPVGATHLRLFIKPGSYPWPAEIWPGR